MIALGSDQAGYELKQVVMRHLEERGLSYKDYGSYSPDPVDYPVYGKKVAHAIVDGEWDRHWYLDCREQSTGNSCGRMQ